jgi:hypothetical protein
MSIAVSAMVKPSSFLSIMAGGMLMIAIINSICISLDVVGHLPLFLRYIIGVFSFFMAVTGGCCIFLKKEIFLIDISGAGQIRLRVNKNLPIAAVVNDDEYDVICKKNSGFIVNLMENSTLWSIFLIVRLQAEDERVTVLIIFPDSVSRENFRALSVAFRWIALHNIAVPEEKFQEA